MNLAEYIESLMPLFLLAVLFWLISMVKKDVSIVDNLWALFFIAISLYSYLQIDSPSLRTQVVTLLVLLWGIRLSSYITLRNWGKEEDHRYQQIRARNEPYFSFKSLYLIFIFQAVIAWLVALPLLFAIHSHSSWGLLDWLGIILWLAGMFFETLADFQLRRFKRDPANKGKINDQGLWSYTRHPNYFGEFLIWWGFFSFSLSASGYVTIISPLIMTFLLIQFSGVRLLENTMSQRPGYKQYMASTNAFFPGPKKLKTVSKVQS